MVWYFAVCSIMPSRDNRSCPSISSGHVPLSLCERWQADPRILDVAEIKTVPYAPLSHPFVQRLIGSFVVLNNVYFVKRDSLHTRKRKLQGKTLSGGKQSMLTLPNSA